MFKIVIVGAGICGAAGCGQMIYSRFVRAAEVSKQEAIRIRAATEQQHRSIQGMCDAYYRWRDDTQGGHGVAGLDQFCFDAQEMKP